MEVTVSVFSEIEWEVLELLRLVQYYRHYKTGTVKQIAREKALKIAKMLE